MPSSNDAQRSGWADEAARRSPAQAVPLPPGRRGAGRPVLRPPHPGHGRVHHPRSRRRPDPAHLGHPVRPRRHRCGLLRSEGGRSGLCWSGRSDRGDHARHAGPDDDLGAPAVARDAPSGRVRLPAAADHPRDRAGGRTGPRLCLGRVLPGRVLAVAGLRLRRARPALCLPCTGCRPERDRRENPCGGRSFARRGMADRHVARHPSQRTDRGALGGLPVRRPRPR